MREHLLAHLKNSPGLRVVDADMQHLLGSWFNPVFWNSMKLPGLHLLNSSKIILHVVHAIYGWRTCAAGGTDLVDAMLSFILSYQCYLYSVEVALVPSISQAVGPR